MARRNVPAISLEVDLTDGYEALGFMTGMATEIQTDRYMASVLEMAHALMAEQFDHQMDMVAMNNQSAYHHVYEWRMIGQPQARLWRHKLTGRGGVREASFQWKASKTPILTPQERQSDPLGTNDPMVGVPDEKIEKLSNRSYIFYWKAPMMEFNLPARVRPRYAKRLFVPSWRAKDNVFYSMETFQDFSRANPQDGSGGRGPVGRFTATWVEWWSNTAPRIFDNQVKTVVEKDLGLTEKEMLRAGRSKKKTVGLKAFGGGSKGFEAAHFAAYEAGRNRAMAILKGKARSYSQSNKYIDNHGDFGEYVNYDEL